LDTYPKLKNENTIPFIVNQQTINILTPFFLLSKKFEIKNDFRKYAKMITPINIGIKLTTNVYR
jgi:hypothetical protein